MKIRFYENRIKVSRIVRSPIVTAERRIGEQTLTIKMLPDQQISGRNLEKYDPRTLNFEPKLIKNRPKLIKKETKIDQKQIKIDQKESKIDQKETKIDQKETKTS